MFRALSTRKSYRGYEQLFNETTVDDGLPEAKMLRSTTMPAGNFPVKGAVERRIPAIADVTVKQAKKASKIHPLFSLFERKKKATAKPEFSRYIQYLREGGVWDANSDRPVIY
ncbi:hypothetical protein E3N88_02387 [Mikania micrantha]|uniref:Uncharacterized protein n=1 Tax=Mikania micrantha TaxID=192012 RepID=A0A5N6Q5K5_9ASTR|nr:hypothetical protein E3N88_02387 [Mikania micrantha]